MSGLLAGAATGLVASDAGRQPWVVALSIAPVVGVAVLAYQFVQRWSPRLVQEHVDVIDVFQKIADLSEEAYFAKDLSGVYLMANTEAALVLGLRPDQLLGSDDSAWVDGEELQTIESSDAWVVQTGQMRTFEYELTTATGRRRFLVTKSPLRNRRGEVIGVIGVSRDVTSSRRAEEELRIASIAFEGHEGIFVADRSGRIVRANSGCCRMVGLRPSEIVGMGQSAMYSRGSGPGLLDAVAERVNTKGEWRGELLVKRHGGRDFVAWVTISAVRDESGETTHIVHSFSDLTLYRTATQEIHRLANYDALTKLPNRSRVGELIAAAVERCSSDDNAGAVVVVDVDNFKHLNETRGHPVGDQLLVEIADRLADLASPSSRVARLGGDEFVIVLTDLARTDATRLARRYCERVLAAMARPVALDGGEYQTSVSLGISVFVGGRDDPTVVLRKAGMAMNQAKLRKGGSYAFFEQNMEFALKERSWVEADLQTATNNDELMLYFQPQFDRDLQIVGAEALIRWAHPTRGVIGPKSFIPIAEESGLIFSVGTIVVDRACAQLALWQEQGWDLTIAVNVSARQFRQVGFVRDIRNAIEQQGADPAKLKIELTESMVLEDIDGAIRRMRSLRSSGIRFSLDDFGTGYSSLSYLTRLPLDELKIDRSFVSSVLDDQNHAVIADSIISLASGLGLRVVAEGVETLEQLDYLRAHNCDVFQGYHLGRPVAGPEFASSWLPPASTEGPTAEVEVLPLAGCEPFPPGSQ